MADTPDYGTESRTLLKSDTLDRNRLETSISALPSRQIYGHAIYQGDKLRTLIVDRELIHFTPTEYRILVPILDAVTAPVSFKQLTECALDRESSRDARRLLDKHVDHIRSKLRPCGLNIRCVSRFGYMLLPDA